MFNSVRPCGPCLPSSSVHGILQARILEWLHAFLQGIFPTQGLNPGRLHLLHWQVGSLPLAPPGKPRDCSRCCEQVSKGTFFLPCLEAMEAPLPEVGNPSCPGDAEDMRTGSLYTTGLLRGPLLGGSQRIPNLLSTEEVLIYSGLALNQPTASRAGLLQPKLPKLWCCEMFHEKRIVWHSLRNAAYASLQFLIHGHHNMWKSLVDLCLVQNLKLFDHGTKLIRLGNFLFNVGEELIKTPKISDVWPALVKCWLIALGLIRLKVFDIAACLTLQTLIMCLTYYLRLYDLWEDRRCGLLISTSLKMAARC